MKRTSINTQAAIKILELPNRFTHAELKTAHREQVQVWHPDRFRHNLQLFKKGEARTKEINAAYDHLRTLLVGDILDYPKEESGKGNVSVNAELERQTRELQRALDQLRQRSHEQVSLLQQQHAAALLNLNQQQKLNEELLRQEFQKKETVFRQSADSLAEQVKLKTRAHEEAQNRATNLEQKICAEHEHNRKIRVRFNRWIYGPFEAVVTSIVAAHLKAWHASTGYLQQVVPNHNDRVSITCFMVFLIGLMIFLFGILIPRTTLIVVTCFALLAGLGHIVLRKD